MTCIVAIVEKGSMFMAGDSAGVGVESLSIQMRKEPKVFKLQDKFLVGCCGSFRAMNLLQHKFEPPAQPDAQDDHEYMVTHFIDEVRKVFLDAGYTLKEDNVEVIDAQFLVAYKGAIYAIEEDFQCGILAEPFGAIGCGGDIALGSLFSTKNKPARERMTVALEAAETFSGGVRRPWTIEILKG